MPTATTNDAAGEVLTHRTRTLVLRLLRQYPVRTAVVVSLTLLSGLAEGVSVVTLLPVLGLAAGMGEESMPGLAVTVEDGLRAVGVEPTIGVLLVILVAGMVGKAVLKLVAMWQAGIASAQIATDLRLALIDSLMRARWGYFVEQPTGRLTNAVSHEAERASLAFTKTAHLIGGSVQVAVYVAVAVLVSWQIALLAVVLGGVMVLSLSGLVRASRRAGERQTILLRSLISRLTDALYAIKPLKAMGRENGLRPLLENETREVNTAKRQEIVNRAAVESFHEPIVTMFVAVTIYVLLVILGMPFAEIVFMSFLFYRTTMNVGSLQRHLQQIVVVQSALASIGESIGDAKAAAEPLKGGEEPPDLTSGIRFHNVTFSYGDKRILNRLTAAVPAGELTAIVGPSGIGKTTFADLVAGLYYPTSGGILVDDVPLDSINLSAWRDRIGYVPQDTVLFHDSVYENICISDHRMTEDDVERALRAADAWTFVSGLPKGMHTLVGEHGLKLSGGQRQRLAIARAIVHGPSLLILDEATTALDPETEAGILETIRGLRGEVTILAISHQSGVLSVADHVIELRDGRATSVIPAGSVSTTQQHVK